MEEIIQKTPVYKLTTIDNPFHPIDEYDQWHQFDFDHGYGCDEYVDRIASLKGKSPFLSEAESQRIDNDAIDEILLVNAKLGLDIYKKVVIEDDED